MRLREREPELSPEVERELRALDRALAGEPVPAEFAGVAELARELREERPVVEPSFAAWIDERAAGRFAPSAPKSDQATGGDRLERLLDRLRAMPRRRLVAPAGAAATLLIVVSVVISQSGGPGEGDRIDPVQPQTEPALPEGEGATEPQVAGDPPVTDVEEDAATGAGRAMVPSAAPPGAAEAGIDLQGAGERKIAQRVDLALSTEPSELRDVADRVLEVTDRHRGFVVNSSVSTGDPGSRGAETGRASFELKIPARELQPALAELSDLAHVSSRTDGTVDITNRFNSARSRIERATEERDRLLRKLANADTFNERRAIRQQIEIVEDELEAAQEALGDARQRVKLVPVTVTVTAEGEPEDGEWGIGDAIDDAGKVLTVAAGILLVSGAVLLPLALLVALLALAWRATLRLRRERALDAA